MTLRNVDINFFAKPGPQFTLIQGDKEPSLREMVDYYYKSNGCANWKLLADTYISSFINDKSGT